MWLKTFAEHQGPLNIKRTPEPRESTYPNVEGHKTRKKEET